MAIVTLTSNESGANSLIDINANFVDLDTTKADIASPTFTGSPVLPTGTTGVTQTASDNSTKLATTAYVDTGLSSITLADDQLKIANITVTAAELKALNASPKTLIAAPGAGKAIVLDDVTFNFTYVAPQYTAGGDLEIRYNSVASNYFQLPTETLVIRGTANFSYQYTRNGGGYSYPKINDPIILKNAGTEFATGNGTAKVILKYRIITL